MPTLADLKASYYAALGYTGSLADMEYAYFNNVTGGGTAGTGSGIALPGLSLGIVRVISPYATAYNGAATANTIYYHRVIESGSISAIRLNTNIQSGNICVGVYSSTGAGLNAKPLTLKQSSGSIACPAVGTSDIPLGATVSVSTGDWIALGIDNVTSKFAGNAGTDGTSVPGTVSNGMFGYQSGLFLLPTTAAYLPSNSRMFNIIGVP